MTIREANVAYLKQGKYFAPEYEQENIILDNFRLENPVLDFQQVSYLIDVLENGKTWEEKYFVADLLYLYKDISLNF